MSSNLNSSSHLEIIPPYMQCLSPTNTNFCSFGVHGSLQSKSEEDLTQQFYEELRVSINNMFGLSLPEDSFSSFESIVSVLKQNNIIRGNANVQSLRGLADDAIDNKMKDCLEIAYGNIFYVNKKVRPVGFLGEGESVYNRYNEQKFVDRFNQLILDWWSDQHGLKVISNSNSNSNSNSIVISSDGSEVTGISKKVRDALLHRYKNGFSTLKQIRAFILKLLDSSTPFYLLDSGDCITGLSFLEFFEYIQKLQTDDDEYSHLIQELSVFVTESMNASYEILTQTISEVSGEINYIVNTIVAAYDLKKDTSGSFPNLKRYYDALTNALNGQSSTSTLHANLLINTTDHNIDEAGFVKDVIEFTAKLNLSFNVTVSFKTFDKFVFGRARAVSLDMVHSTIGFEQLLIRENPPLIYTLDFDISKIEEGVFGNWEMPSVILRANSYDNLPQGLSLSKIEKDACDIGTYLYQLSMIYFRWSRISSDSDNYVNASNLPAGVIAGAGFEIWSGLNVFPANRSAIVVDGRLVGPYNTNATVSETASAFGCMFSQSTFLNKNNDPHVEKDFKLGTPGIVPYRVTTDGIKFALCMLSGRSLQDKANLHRDGTCEDIIESLSSSSRTDLDAVKWAVDQFCEVSVKKPTFCKYRSVDYLEFSSDTIFSRIKSLRTSILKPDVTQLSAHDRQEVIAIAGLIRQNGFTEVESYVNSMFEELKGHGFDRKDVRKNLGQEGISVPSWVPNPNSNPNPK